jgi:hypothetical protein
MKVNSNVIQEVFLNINEYITECSPKQRENFYSKAFLLFNPGEGRNPTTSERSFLNIDAAFKVHSNCQENLMQ